MMRNRYEMDDVDEDTMTVERSALGFFGTSNTGDAVAPAVQATGR